MLSRRLARVKQSNGCQGEVNGARETTVVQIDDRQCVASAGGNRSRPHLQLAAVQLNINSLRLHNPALRSVFQSHMYMYTAGSLRDGCIVVARTTYWGLDTKCDIPKHTCFFGSRGSTINCLHLWCFTCRTIAVLYLQNALSRLAQCVLVYRYDAPVL